MINDRIKIEDININYIQYGSGKINMVLLHGWGQNIKMMMPIANAFKSIFKIALSCNSSKIILIHNHPSEVAQPSKCDYDITNKLKQQSA